MIFVTVGTQLPFDRLLTAVDTWLEGKGTKAFAQSGGGRADWRHLESKSFLTPQEFDVHFEQAELIVAHAGMGSILSALATGKPLVIMPRRAAFGEHRNDHQMATARRFAAMSGVKVVFDENEIPLALDELVGAANVGDSAVISPYAPELFLERIRGLING